METNWLLSNLFLAVTWLVLSGVWFWKSRWRLGSQVFAWVLALALALLIVAGTLLVDYAGARNLCREIAMFGDACVYHPRRVITLLVAPFVGMLGWVLFVPIALGLHGVVTAMTSTER